MARTSRTPVVPGTRAGAALAEWIEAERRSQAWVALQIRSDSKDKLHQMTISRWIGGVVPPANYAVRIENLCGIPVAWWDEPMSRRRSGRAA